MSEWISVKDRLPDRFDWVLISGKSPEWVTCAMIGHNGKWELEYVFEENISVSWWMPLPEPPKE